MRDTDTLDPRERALLQRAARGDNLASVDPDDAVANLQDKVCLDTLYRLWARGYVQDVKRRLNYQRPNRQYYKITAIVSDKGRRAAEEPDTP